MKSLVSFTDFWNVLSALPNYIWGKIWWLWEQVRNKIDFDKANFFHNWFDGIAKKLEIQYSWLAGPLAEIKNWVTTNLPNLNLKLDNLPGLLLDNTGTVLNSLFNTKTGIFSKIDFDKQNFFTNWFDGIAKKVENNFEWLSPKITNLKTTLTEGNLDLTSAFQQGLGGMAGAFGLSLTELPNKLAEAFKNMMKIDVLTEDAGLASQFMGLFTKFEREAEFGEHHAIASDSMVEPNEAYEKSWKVRAALVGSIIAFGVVAAVIELAGLGQLETPIHLVKSVFDAGGWMPLAQQIPMIEYEAMLLKPLRYHYNQQYTPNIPGMSDLVRFRVREAITQEELEKWAKYQGFDVRFSLAYWDAHWELPSPAQGYEMEARTDFTETELEELLIMADFHPKYRDRMMETRFATITRVDLRRLWQAGDILTPELEERMKHVGYSPLDARLVAQAQIRQAMTEQTGLLITNVKKAHKDGWLNETDLEMALSDMGLPERQKSYHLEDAKTDRDLEEREEYRDALRDAFRKDLMDAGEYYGRLVELGLEDWKASMLVAREQIRKGEWPFE